MLYAVNQCFNPRARAGRDLNSLILLVLVMTSFNPRARAGRDIVVGVIPFNVKSVSIHAPVRGATYF